MSVFLITSSLVTTLLIPAEAFEPGGEANGRALAYLAHEFLGDAFGTVYDISSVLILWFAGASAMAGLINIVPRYLPTYGMAPEWSRAVRPVVLVYTTISILITIAFNADVDAQAGAYATGILAMMVSASFAVLVSAIRRRQRIASVGFAVLTLILGYALVENIIEKPDGIAISCLFILGIVVVSRRLPDLAHDRDPRRAHRVRRRRAAVHHGLPGVRRPAQHHRQPARVGRRRRVRREGARAAPAQPRAGRADVLFLEINVVDPSEFREVLQVRGVEIDGHRVLRADSPAAPNAIAAILLAMRDATGRAPARVLRVVRGQPAPAHDALHPARPRRHRARRPRDHPRGREGPRPSGPSSTSAGSRRADAARVRAEYAAPVRSSRPEGEADGGTTTNGGAGDAPNPAPAPIGGLPPDGPPRGRPEGDARSRVLAGVSLGLGILAAAGIFSDPFRLFGSGIWFGLLAIGALVLGIVVWSGVRRKGGRSPMAVAGIWLGATMIVVGLVPGALLLLLSERLETVEATPNPTVVAQADADEQHRLDVAAHVAAASLQRYRYTDGAYPDALAVTTDGARLIAVDGRFVAELPADTEVSYETHGDLTGYSLALFGTRGGSAFAEDDPADVTAPPRATPSPSPTPTPTQVNPHD